MLSHLRRLLPSSAERSADAAALDRCYVEAIHRSQAVIEFDLDGTVREANPTFLTTMGYAAEEVIGRHHRQFVDPAEAETTAYRAFWARLARGEFQTGRFRRVAKDGREVWLQATYNPIVCGSGEVVGVVKIASDVTEQVQRAAEHQGQVEAIDRSQAVIEFDLDGTIRTANANFLAATGYTLDEVVGKHHRMFMPSQDAESVAYRAFWERLGAGEFHSGQFRRVAKGGRELWLQATYNPIFDADGRPTRVMKFATDVTAQVQQQRRLEAGVGSMFALIDAASGASAEISSSTDRLSAATAEQSDQSREIASAVEQMVTTVAENARSSARASEVAGSNGATAQEGARVVAETTDKIRRMAAVVGESVATVDRLGAASGEIGRIVATITDIADQTNLLALNAAIEAARAGEHGRGFAVVAGEVGKLAERTTRATDEIAALIGSVQTETGAAVEAMRRGEAEVAGGLELADRAGQALEQIVTGTAETVHLVAQIAAATEEQSATSEQISQSVEQVHVGVEESARALTAIAQETAESRRLMEELRAQAAGLGGRAEAVPHAAPRAGGDGMAVAPTLAVPMGAR